MTSGEWHIPCRVDFGLSIILGWISHRWITKAQECSHGYLVTNDIGTGFYVYIAGQKLTGCRPQGCSILRQLAPRWHTPAVIGGCNLIPRPFHLQFLITCSMSKLQAIKKLEAQRPGNEAGLMLVLPGLVWSGL